MFILLPPSEKKRPDAGGAPWRDAACDPSAIFAADTVVGDVRHKVLSEVSRLCADDPVAAVTALKLPPGDADAMCLANARVFDSPAMPALDRYAGVLYDGLDVASMSRAARKIAESSVLIFSGGLGVVRGKDAVPWYRVPASAKLPVGGNVAALWRPALAEALPPLLGEELCVDLRSSDYAALWRARRENVVAVRVLRRRKVGRAHVEQVISFHSKLTKGRLARALLDAAARRRKITSVDAVVDIATSLGLEPRETRAGLDLVDAAG